MHKSPDPEFSLTIRPADIGAEGARYKIEASAEERSALAARFGLVALESFSADLRVEWLRGHKFLRLSGRLRAQVVQSCVVTLQPVRSTIDAPFEVVFGEETPEQEGVIDLHDVEPLPADKLDIGEVAAEELALLLDPYPRLPGAQLEQAGFGPTVGPGARTDDADPARNRPFEVLAALKRKK